jgi:long-chain acyl-CoA synthetase
MQNVNIPYTSAPDMLRKNAARFKDDLALKYRKDGKFVTLSYREFYERALMTARGLKRVNVKAGDRVAILSENRADWVIADMGILCARGVTVSIYPTNPPEQVKHVLNHSEAKIVFVSGKAQYEKLVKIRESIPGVELVVSFDPFMGDPALPVCSFNQLSEIDLPVTDIQKQQLETFIDCMVPDDLQTIIYTSGTTGVPKGAMLTHKNILLNAYHISKKSGVWGEQNVHLSFLPLSHVLERTVGYYLGVMNGSLIAFADSIEKVPENLLEVKPTVMVSVPRLFEKIYSKIFDNVHQMPATKQNIFHWAIGVGKQYARAKYIEKKSVPFLAFQYKIAERLVFGKLRERFGGNMKLFCCGGAPLDKTINEFFWSIGLPILEGYGLTETSPAICFNSFDQVRYGSVGTALENTEIMTDTDGEILVKGPQVMSGYYKDAEATSEAMQNGWFRTGDIGRIENGFVWITDRKKELIITAGGKNIAPQPIENALKLDPYISQAFVYGDRKPYLTALVVPDQERVLAYAREKGISGSDGEALVLHEPIRKLYEQRIAEINGTLAPYETIKKFVLVPRDFSIEGGELTSTLKLRRKIICEKYKDKIEGMYADNNLYSTILEKGFENGVVFIMTRNASMIEAHIYGGVIILLKSLRLSFDQICDVLSRGDIREITFQKAEVRPELAQAQTIAYTFPPTVAAMASNHARTTHSKLIRMVDLMSGLIKANKDEGAKAFDIMGRQIALLYPGFLPEVSAIQERIDRLHEEFGISTRFLDGKELPADIYSVPAWVFTHFEAIDNNLMREVVLYFVLFGEVTKKIVRTTVEKESGYGAKMSHARLSKAAHPAMQDSGSAIIFRGAENIGTIKIDWHTEKKKTLSLTKTDLEAFGLDGGDKINLILAD